MDTDESAADSPARGRFVTLENFILDTFTQIEDDGTEHPIDRPDEIGGAGTYTVIGARIFLPSYRIGMIIDYTPETFPKLIKEKLDHYGQETFIFRDRRDGQPTLRAVNRYKGQLRIFEYLTAPIFLTPNSWAGTVLEKPLPTIIHFVPMRERISQVVDEVEEIQRSNPSWHPILIWEPDIPACIPENLELIRGITPRTHVISPNHSEALSLLDLQPISAIPPDRMVAHLSRACVLFAQMRPRLAAVIRCGHLGCCYVDTSAGGTVEVNSVIWVPAYWNSSVPEHKQKVIDPTGAGNAFMGGLGAALDQGKSIYEAVLWATVAASFVIEQNGLPNLMYGHEEEIWNGEKPMDRVEKLRARLRA